MRKTNLPTAREIENDVFSGFKNDKERIKFMSRAFRNMSIADAFATYYSMEAPKNIKNDNVINNVTTISIGGMYSGIVKEFTGTLITFEIPGVKEEIICKENFNSCSDNINNYLLTHNNTLMFEVREHKDGKFIVSVINAYYLYWQELMKNAIANNDRINVHIDSLVKGGYVCHTDIEPLVELTGKKYTSSVFIPGSQIVLNIEKDFERWVGQDVEIIPQNFVEFRKDLATGCIENSLVGSRKKILQYEGVKNLYEIWNDFNTQQKLAQLAEGNVKPTVYEGTVTGMINSNKKTGVFVELNNKYITGLLPMDADDALNYKPGDSINVTVKEFDIQEGKEPFILNKRKVVVKCNTRPVFAKA